ncbi:hypothetical protein FOJ82_12730 [Tessaracoccus rhinocerotis]|uniref:Uncharacterized protein n=1 Tax=Tessaracoccus rhinocerotis TaxID=1689449 RepID=A0A553JY66_9ACTN|nr:hypothetical protein [Tessaracoccus rhinocerotis]TRY17398.1 hypothetical protein FOJ82_12730 [Tessaracoccus rhinocerotis]
MVTARAIVVDRESRHPTRKGKLFQAAIGVGLAAAFVLAGCGSPPPAEPLVGMTVLQVEATLPDATLVIYDVSTPVLGLDPTFTNLRGGAFTVISACGGMTDSAQEVVPLAVIPTTEVTEQIRERANAGRFDDQLSECSP